MALSPVVSPPTYHFTLAAPQPQRPTPATGCALPSRRPSPPRETLLPSASAFHAPCQPVVSPYQVIRWAPPKGVNAAARTVHLISNPVLDKALRTAPKKCVSCGTEETPQWRLRKSTRQRLCNACGLHELLAHRREEQARDRAEPARPQPAKAPERMSINFLVNAER